MLVLPAQQIEEVWLAALIAMRTSTGPGSGVGNCVHDRAFGPRELSREHACMALPPVPKGKIRNAAERLLAASESIQ